MNSLVLNSLTYGMYAIGVKGENGPSACIINGVSRVGHGTTTMVAITLNSSSYTCERIKATEIFSISVLSEETSGVAIGALGLVSGRNADKLSNLRHKVLTEGVPVLKENTCCWFLCELVSSTQADDQTIFVGKIIAGSEKAVGTPMTYSFYREKLGGFAPKNSPVYIQPKKSLNGNGGNSFVCSVCGYIYDDPNFAFEELPDNWKCPVCKMSKKAYIRNI